MASRSRAAGMAGAWRSNRAPHSVPATPLSRVVIRPKTGGFASPPRGGFALSVRGELTLFSLSPQTVTAKSHVAEKRPNRARKRVFKGNSSHRYLTAPDYGRACP